MKDQFENRIVEPIEAHEYIKKVLVHYEENTMSLDEALDTLFILSEGLSDFRDVFNLEESKVIFEMITNNWREAILNSKNMMTCLAFYLTNRTDIIRFFERSLENTSDEDEMILLKEKLLDFE